ncbi:unnamed protein product [Cyclocybe aegerita]|uniref:Uncharacterized protein n=1 Tax=Cyclocybe aegerita TaxID=1973307 RepID=A0A8S0W194_CYCAE|nr:unnamed protein product [Cyclocybe aegerita]
MRSSSHGAPLVDASQSLMFNQCHITQVDGRPVTLRKGFKILCANVDETLLHDSIDRDADEVAIQNSNAERQIINKVVDWAENPAHVAQAAVVYSPAPLGGTSPAARLLSESCHKNGVLPSTTTSDKKEDNQIRRHVVATIAYQIALALPAARPFIEDAVEHDPAIFRRSFRPQIERLIQGPLRQPAETPMALFQPSSSIIVMDGLDPAKSWHQLLLKHLHQPDPSPLVLRPVVVLHTLEAGKHPLFLDPSYSSLRLFIPSPEVSSYPQQSYFGTSTVMVYFFFFTP